MFTNEELKLMYKLGLNFDFDHLSDEDWCEIEEKVGEHLSLNCLGDDYAPNTEGLLCEAILAKLP